MSKVIAAMAATGGAATVAVGGSFLVKNGLGEGTDGEQSSKKAEERGADASSTVTSPTPTPETISADLNFTDLNGFKTNNGGDCGKQFTNLNLSSGGTKIESGVKIDSTYFSSGTGEKSCLVVNWERTDSTETPSKWKGNFRWVWSFVKGNKGFITFTTTKLSNSDSQLDLEGGIYFVQKADSADTWSVDKYKTLENKNITKSNFPKVGDSLTDVKNKDYWGFMTSDGDLSNICKESEKNTCTKQGDQQKTFKGSWTWDNSNEGATTDTLVKWCKEFSSFFGNMYETTEIDLTSTFQSFTGAWKKEQLSENPSK